MPIKKTGDGVYYADGPVVEVSRKTIQWLREQATRVASKRARLCAHPGVNSSLHEMLIVLCQETWVPPHMHPDKSESFHVIEGVLDVALFDESGHLCQVVPMGDFSSELPFFYRIPAGVFHTPVVRSRDAVIHETTNGPFGANDSTIAPWYSSQSLDVTVYRRNLTRAIDLMKSKRK